MLWFDVEKNGYTTPCIARRMKWELWFDVEKNGYTTPFLSRFLTHLMWFDVEKNGYTTVRYLHLSFVCCGLM